MKHFKPNTAARGVKRVVLKRPASSAAKPLKAKPLSAVPKPRYSSDPDFRERSKEASRLKYRRGKDGGFELVGCLRSLEFFEEQAEHLAVTNSDHGGAAYSAPVYKMMVLADLMQVSYQSLWRNVNGGLIPAPVLVHHIGKRELPVYHRDEVRVILTIVGEHKRQFAYYRNDHTSTREKLFAAIDSVRSKWETDKPWQSANPASRPQPQRRPLLKRPRK